MKTCIPLAYRGNRRFMNLVTNLATNLGGTRLVTHFVFLLTVTILFSGCYRKPATTSSHSNSTTTATDRNETSTTSFQPSCDNVALDIEYVSDQKCAECHEDIAQQYAKHPMANSLAPANSDVAADGNTLALIESFGASNNAEFVSGQFQYRAKMQEGKLVHSRTLLAASDDAFDDAADNATTNDDSASTQNVTLQSAHEIDYVVGSGQRGRSYLIDDDEHLFMSPLTWYPQKARWDLSPGYEHNDLGFHRPVLEDCLFCHSNGANLVPHQKNTYAKPTFDQTLGSHSIGCQRCHGPGALHVARHESGNPIDSADDRTIANPSRMQPAVREAVCQQCHLAGAARVEVAGKSRYDFRPGMPLESAMATFILNPALPQNETHFVGQVEQMYASRCFTASDGQLGCISCHDPHSVPDADDKIRFYRNRCVRCHAEESCGQPLDDRLNEDGVDDCIGCHMPTITTDVRHAASTDHRIPRRSNAKPPRQPRTKNPQPVVAFPPRMLPITESDALRNRSLAMLEAAAYHPRKITAEHLLATTPPLDRYVIRHRTDIAALEALGDLLNRNHQRGSEDRYATVLGMAPDREHSMVQLANTTLARGDLEEAVERWQQICDRHPSMPSYRSMLARALEKAGRWREMLDVAESGTKSFPTFPEFWQHVVTANVALGQEEEAKRALQLLIRFQPENKSQINAWFENHPAR